MKITKKILERIIEEEVSKLLEVEGVKYPNTREIWRKKVAVVDFFREGLSLAHWPGTFKDLTVDGDESGAEPDAFTIILKPARRPSREELKQLRQYIEINKFFKLVKGLFNEKSRLAHIGSLKKAQYDRFDAFVLEGSVLKVTGEWEFRFKWSKKVAMDSPTALAGTLFHNKLTQSLSDLSRERHTADRLGTDIWKSSKPSRVELDK